MVKPDNVLVEIPIVLRDLLADHRLHPRQPFYEVLEEALLHWLDDGAPRKPFNPDDVEMRLPSRAYPVRR